MESRKLQFILIAVLMTFFGPARASEVLKFDNMRAHALCAEIDSSKFRNLCEQQIYMAVFDEKALEVCAVKTMPYDRYSCLRMIRNKIFGAQAVSSCKQASYPDMCLTKNASVDLNVPGVSLKLEANAVLSALDKAMADYKLSKLPNEIKSTYSLALEVLKAEIIRAVF